MNTRAALLSATICAVAPVCVHGATLVSGAIANQTWTKLNSPYVLIGDVSVARLTVQPGVQIISAGQYVFEIAGGITARGTKEEPILFTTTNANGWRGIFFNFNPLPSELSFCVVERSVAAGIRIFGSEPLLKSCTVANNYGTTGGGIFATNVQSVELVDCTISNNFSSLGPGGGALIVASNLTLRGCTIVSNRSYGAGGGIHFTSQTRSRLALWDCLIVGNVASGDAAGFGGGLNTPFSTNSNSVTITRSTFRGNVADGYSASYGGALRCYGNVAVANCAFIRNSARSVAGVDYGDSNPGRTFYFANCFFAFNRSTGGGGSTVALYNLGPPFGVTNCVFAYNEGSGVGFGSPGFLVNSIVWANTVQIAGSPSATYCDVQDGYPGTGNISINPVFASLETFALLDASPCVDGGNPDSSFNDVCFPPSQGTVRNDMGAYGGPGACAWPTAPVIAKQPISHRSCLGCQVDFSVEATGETPFVYQWRINGNPITGATRALYRLSTVTSNDVGAYTVLISNAYGEVISNPAFLTIAAPSLTIDLYPGLTISGVVGQMQRIEYRPQLADSNAWTFLTNIQQAFPDTLWVDPEPARAGQKFYRVLEQP